MDLPLRLSRWNDPKARSLGKLGSIDCEPKADWCLVLGQSETGKEAIMSIHLPLKPSPNSKHTGDIYLMLPLESLDVGASALRHGELTRADGEGETDVVHVHLVFMKPGYALMPVPEAQRPLKGRPVELLSNLKSLSRTGSFDLYLPHTTANVYLMDTLFKHLREGTLCTAEINHKSTFSGRRWGRDAWTAYGLRDDDVVGESPPLYEEVVNQRAGREDAPAHSVAKIDNACKSPRPDPNNASTNVERGSQDVKSPRTVSKHAVTDAPADSPADVPAEADTEADTLAMDPMQWLLNHPELWPQHGAPCSLPDTQYPSESEANSSKDVQHHSEDHEEGSREQAQGEDLDHSLESRECSGYAQEQVTGLLSAPDEAEGELHRKRKAREALSDSEPSSGPPIRSVRQTRATGNRKRMASGRDGTPHEQPRILIKSPLRRFYEEGLKFTSCSIFCNGKSRNLFDSTQYRWFIELVLWMRKLWHRQGNFHEAYLKELGTLCQAIKARDRRAFETIRLQCMSSFVEGERRPPSVLKSPFEYRRKDRVDYIIKFLYCDVGPGADELAVDDLIALRHQVVGWETLGGEDCPELQRVEEWYQHGLAFDTQMCACVLVALYKSLD